MLHQVFRRRAVRLAGGHHPLLLWGGPLLWMRPCGSHGHRHHPGDLLLQGDQRPRHANRHVSGLPSALPTVCYTKESKKKFLGLCNRYSKEGHKYRTRVEEGLTFYELF